MFFLYQSLLVLLYVAALLLFPILLCLRFSKEQWKQRLALFLKEPKQGHKSSTKVLYFHAASAGEVRLLEALLQKLSELRPGLRIHLSVMTSAGYLTAQQLYQKKLSLPFTLSYLPLDLYYSMRRFLSRLQANVIVLTEGEHWPGLLYAAKSMQIPVILINARVSEKSFHRMLFFSKTHAKLLNSYQALFCRSDIDKQRYLRLGLASEKLFLAGDLKFELPLQIPSASKRKARRRSLGFADEDFIWIAGSTREGEEGILLSVFHHLQGKSAGFRSKAHLILAPRHIKRLGKLSSLLMKAGISCRLYSSVERETQNRIKQQRSRRVSCTLVDKMGVLKELYSAADLAFVGGTMADVGGHNILEPLWAGTPVIFGPDVRNVQEMAKYVLEGNYGAQAKTTEELSLLVENVFLRKTRFQLKKQSPYSAPACEMILAKLLKELSIESSKAPAPL